MKISARKANECAQYHDCKFKKRYFGVCNFSWPFDKIMDLNSETQCTYSLHYTCTCHSCLSQIKLEVAKRFDDNRDL